LTQIKEDPSLPEKEYKYPAANGPGKSKRVSESWN